MRSPDNHRNRVLCVSPNFAPVNAPDSHRVRLLAPLLPRFGWDCEVLSLEPRLSTFPVDPWLAEGVTGDLPVHRAGGLSAAPWSRFPGLGSAGVRGLSGLIREGDALLSTGRFDLVYFSTTSFELNALGPRWLERFGIPFVLDFQDEWVTDYYRQRPDVPPPGGRLKYAMADRISRVLERRTLRHCAGITSVSPAYRSRLVARYPWVANTPELVLPFPASPSEVARVSRALPIAKPQSRDRLTWTYVGVVPPQMERSIAAFFDAVARYAPGTLLKRLKLAFVGTAYDPGATEGPVLKIARRYGIDGLVEEDVQRAPYGEALERLISADAILAFGTDDPAYSPSKIFACLLARRPLLAVYHEVSFAASLMSEVGGGVIIPFSDGEAPADIASRIAAGWLESGAFERVGPLDETAFAPFTEEASAEALARFFTRCRDNAK